VYGTVRTVVWEDGGGNPASYPIQGNVNGSNRAEVWPLPFLFLRE
jgi:hypothetical protein